MIKPDAPAPFWGNVGSVPIFGDDEKTVERYRLPRPMPYNTLHIISQRLLEVCGIMPDYATHYVGIANSGTAIATGAMQLHGRSQYFPMLWHSSINLKDPDNNRIFSPDTEFTPLRTILVDNSIRSGNTMRRALALLLDNDVRVDTAVTVVGYGTEQEAEIVQGLEQDFKTKVKFLFDVSEVYPTDDDVAW